MKSLKDFSYLKPLGIAFIISTIFYFIFKDKNEGLEYILMIAMGMTGFYFIISFSVFLVQYLGLLFGKIIGSSERKIKQLDKSDFKLDKEYYREILENNSPLVLGYLDNLELNKNKIIAELLYLKTRNLISIEEGKITKSFNNENFYLLKSETMILDSIYSNQFRISDYDSFLDRLKERVISEAEFLFLVEEKGYRNRNPKIKSKKIDWRKMIDKYLRNYHICTCFFIYYRFIIIS